ncbi:AAA family ATPase [Labedella populi]|nr:AAA family ATPase [Labedella populi]
MDTAIPLALVIVVGPQASGKSTVAAALAAELRRRGERAALVELDQIAAMALPTLPNWEAAHRIFETTVGLWARTGLTCVIAEGSGSEDEVSRLRRQAPSGAVIVVVVTTVTLEAAFARAHMDPTRGISREWDFLNGVYEKWADELVRIGPDVVIDTSRLTVEQGVRRTISRIQSARFGPDSLGPNS